MKLGLTNLSPGATASSVGRGVRSCTDTFYGCASLQSEFRLSETTFTARTNTQDWRLTSAGTVMSGEEPLSAKTSAGFLLDYPDMHCRITPLELERVSTEIHMNRGCSAAEMNRPLEALESKKLFNQKVKEELGDSHPGIDMRYAISWNELGVGYFMVNGENNCVI